MKSVLEFRSFTDWKRSLMPHMHRFLFQGRTKRLYANISFYQDRVVCTYIDASIKTGWTYETQNVDKELIKMWEFLQHAELKANEAKLGAKRKVSA
jgi:hypothetical protein